MLPSTRANLLVSPRTALNDSDVSLSQNANQNFDFQRNQRAHSGTTLAAIDTAEPKRRRNERVNLSVDYAHLERLSRKQGPFAFKREGKIRELAQMVDEQDNSLEKELLNTMKEASKHQKRIYNSLSIDDDGQRFYAGKVPKLKQIQRQADDIDKKKAKDALTMVVAHPKVTFKSGEDSLLPSLPTIKPLLKKRIDEDKMFSRVKHPKDPNLIIQE